MNAQPKNHLKVHGAYRFITNPVIKEADMVMAEALAEEAAGLPPEFILTPVFFSPDKLIYFHGGDFLPHTHLPMPWADNQPWINQYPEKREVGFSPLFSFLIPDSVYEKLPPPDFFDDDIIVQAEYILKARQMGVKVFVTPKVHAVWPFAYRPLIGRKKYVEKMTADHKKFEKKWRKYLDDQYKYPCVFHTIVTYPGGYNLHGYNALKALFEKRVLVYYHFIGGTNEDEGESDCPFIDDFKTQYGSNKLPQVTLCHGTNNFKNSGAYKIAYTTTEVDGIPDDWVKCLNEMDEVWATSEFTKKAFLSSGVKTPAFVVHEGVDPAYFHPEIAPFPNPPKEKFRFVSNFAWGKRKGVDVLFEAFRKEFSDKDDVCLMLKVLPSYSGHNIKDELKLVYEQKGSAPVYLYDIELKKWELGRFYTSGHCFLWPTRGEGFGLPPLEAIACGLPVIASNHSAHLEYLTENGEPKPGVKLISGKVEPYDKGDSIYYPGFNWFNPSVDHLRVLMREVYQNYQKYKDGAMATSAEVRKEWTWHRGANTMLERLSAIYQREWKTS